MNLLHERTIVNNNFLVTVTYEITMMIGIL